MSTGLAYNKYDKGGMCYAGCMEAFEWYAEQLSDHCRYNASMFWC